MSKKCIKCGADLSNDTKFCTECGAKHDALEKCSKCGGEIKIGSKFCTECGEKICDKSPIDEASQQIAIPDFKKLAKNKELRTKWAPIIGFVVFVVLLYLGISGSNNSGSSDSVSGSPAITVKAEELIDDYIRDQASAEKKYKDKEIRITGQLLHKSQFVNSQDYALYIYRKSVAGKEYSVGISIPPKDVSIVNKVNVGDFVNAEGTCVGIVKQQDPTDISIQIHSTKIN